MKTTAALFGLLASASAAAVTNKVSYDGYKVFRVGTVDQAAVDHLKSVSEKLGLQRWEAPLVPGAYNDFAVAPHQLEQFNKLVGDLKPKVMHEDLGHSISQESAPSTYAAGAANATWFQNYHAYNDHLSWMKDLASQFPKNSEIATSGKSLNGNTITGLHLFGNGGKGKPAIVFHGTVHAREWIGTMVTEYIMYNLLNGYGSDQKYLDKFDFYIFPVVNPDGFIYTQTTDRMWRKNLQTNSGTNCKGTDLNRNWPYQWTGSGSSTNPCDEAFRGPSAGSSPENKAVTSFLSSLKKQQPVKLFIDWHSYSQLFMSPYGYTSKVPANNNELQSLLRGAVGKIADVHGTSFDYGPIATTIYPANGNSVDWTTDVLGADYNFAIELRDTGDNGFVLPKEQIVPSGEEMYNGIRYLLDNMK